MFKNTILLSACQPIEQAEITDDFTRVDEPSRLSDHSKPCPFTVMSGEIMCAEVIGDYGQQIYFYPDDMGDDESQVEQPLNQPAIDRLRDARLQQTVPDTVKDGVDLDEYGELFGGYCDRYIYRFLNTLYKLKL